VKAAARVLDSFSLIAYLEGEDGADRMVELFRVARDSGRDLLLSVINWGEVYYITLREAGRERAEQAAHIISTLPNLRQTKRFPTPIVFPPPWPRCAVLSWLRGMETLSW
jgi:predicted nucleic acid-binding protein